MQLPKKQRGAETAQWYAARNRNVAGSSRVPAGAAAGKFSSSLGRTLGCADSFLGGYPARSQYPRVTRALSFQRPCHYVISLPKVQSLGAAV